MPKRKLKKTPTKIVVSNDKPWLAIAKAPLLALEGELHVNKGDAKAWTDGPSARRVREYIDTNIHVAMAKVWKYKPADPLAAIALQLIYMSKTFNTQHQQEERKGEMMAALKHKWTGGENYKLYLDKHGVKRSVNAAIVQATATRFRVSLAGHSQPQHAPLMAIALRLISKLKSKSKTPISESFEGREGTPSVDWFDKNMCYIIFGLILLALIIGIVCNILKTPA